MCGIAGLLNYGAKAADDIEVMKRRMAHRGPDAEGTWRAQDRDVTLGHRRLAVVGLGEAGAQPMVSHSARFAMSYNGEIYNHLFLRERLREKNITDFRGTSDSETLLEALEHFGIDQTLEMAKGMFAIALYDVKTGTLTLARDRVGEKPLYYGFVGGAFVFASDLGSIRALSKFQNGVDTRVLRIYFRHGYIPAPYTIYEGISKLQPGCMLTIRAPYTKDSVAIKPYWSMQKAALYGHAHPFTGTREEAADELERLLTASVKEQMVADVPVGAFLSGGIDSAATVALMQSVSPGKVKSFTIGMNDPQYNEAVYAKEIAAHLGTEHTELYISEDDAKAVIPLLPAMFAEPFADYSQIPTYLVSKMTRERVTVSLSGDGGDELFCGYNNYRRMAPVWEKIKNIPHPMREIAGKAIMRTPMTRNKKLSSVGALVGATSPNDLYRRLFLRDVSTMDLTLSKEDAPYVLTQEIAKAGTIESPYRDFMLSDLLLYHPDDILVKVDRCAMAVSLETRVPFLDRDVVEFAWTLPVSYLCDGDKGKLVLRDVLYRHVPKEMMERPKTGFSIPMMKWLKTPQLRSWAEDLLDARKIRAQGLLNAGAIQTVWRDFIQNDNWRMELWYLLMFQAWYEEAYR